MALAYENLDAVSLHLCRAVDVIFQLIPAPEFNLAEYHYKQQIRFTNAPKNDLNTKKIGSWINGLMNTSGGWIILYCPQPVSFNDVDKWVMGFENILKQQWISASTWYHLIPPFQKLISEDQFRIYIYLCKSPHLVTFDFKAFEKQEASITAIKDERIIMKMFSEEHSSYHPTCISAFADKYGTFQFEESLSAPWFESRKLEFKHVHEKVRKQGVETFESKVLIDRLREYMNYLSAFANCDGGSLVLGVEECGKELVVKGFKVKENQHEQEREEKCVRDYLKKRLGECIWHADLNYEPSEVDWTVFFPVVQEGERTRKLVEICVNKHIGGMFLGTPTYYVINSMNELEEKPRGSDKDKWERFPDWQRDFSRDRTTDEKQHCLDDHLIKPSEESGLPVGSNVSQVRSGGSALGSHVSQEKTETSTPGSVVLLNDFATRLESNVNETRLPKSFHDSDLGQKTSIFIPGLNLHKCCTDGMSKIIQQKLQTTKTQSWYPSLAATKQRLGNVQRWDDLIQVIQSKAWNGVASVIDRSIDTDEECGSCNPILDAMHSTLLCIVIIIDKSEQAKLLYCFGDIFPHDRMTVKDKLVKYALCYGRRLKSEFVNCPANSLLRSHPFHFDVEVLIIPVEGEIITLWNSKNYQSVAYPNAISANQYWYHIALNGLVERLLKARHSVRDRYGKILIEHLTEKQAQMLLETKERVLVVSGKSGTGKTVLALQLMQRARQQGHKEHEVIFICSNEGLKAWINYQVACRVLLVEKTDGLLPNDVGVLKQGKLIVVDDVHAIHLDQNWEKNPNDLYTLLFRQVANHNAEVAIFFDPEQDFEERLPVKFESKLRNLAETMVGLLPQHIKLVQLTDRIRNSQEINRFMQANQNMAGVPGTITCLNEIQGDDVTYEYTGSNVKESASFIHARLNVLEQSYKPGSVAVLCDDHEQMKAVKDLLIRTFHRTLQPVYQYPVKHTVVCNLDDFRGLEADIILFLMHQQCGKEKVKSDWKYRNVISSRARVRLEFLLQWKNTEDNRVLLGYSESDSLLVRATEDAWLLHRLTEDPRLLHRLTEDPGCCVVLLKTPGSCINLLKSPGCCIDLLKTPGCCVVLLKTLGCCIDLLKTPGCCIDILKTPGCCIDLLKTLGCCVVLLKIPNCCVVLLKIPGCCIVLLLLKTP